MIRVGVLMFQNMRYAPFLKMYEKLLSELDNVEYDVIYYERDRNLGEIKDRHHIAVPWCGRGSLAAPKYEKLVNFLLYRRNAKKILKQKKYDFIIVLTSFPAVLLGDYLCKNYAGKFVVDIRDYTQERFKLYFKLEERAFSKAAMCVISSPGFVNFLPTIKYYNCHNIDANVRNIEKPMFEKASGRRIIISYIGSISYETQCKQLINLVVDDDRFEFHFYGNEANGTEISDYVVSLDNPRIKMKGPFLPVEKAGIYANSDLIFNCYGNDRMLVKYAISNKYYDGAIFRKPLLVSPNTSMAECSREFAYALDLENVNDLDKLFQWYQSIDENSYLEFAEQLLNKAMEENNIFVSRIKNIIEESEARV